MDPYLKRCFDLARIPGAAVEPNPRVGALVVHNGIVIGEGWHQLFGTHHAEVNAVNAVADKSLLQHSTLYVSLEPCNHHGKTPPCTSLILKHNIPRVVIGSLDPNPKMAGKSVELLRSKGVEVILHEEQETTRSINDHFRCNQLYRRPYITLKWAESRDGFIARLDGNGRPWPTPISPPFISRWVHYLRHDHQAILVGKNTVLTDDPTLTTRKWPGYSPIRIFLDRNLDIPKTAKIYGSGPVIVINTRRNEVVDNITYFTPIEEKAFDELEMLMTEIFGRLGIGSILVEGGNNTLSQFIQQGLWDEAWKNVGDIELKKGVKAPDPGHHMERRANAPGELWHKKNPALRFP